MTCDEFLEWEKTQTEKHEYLDGLVYPVYAMVGARDAHVTVSLNVASLLKAHLRGGPCRVYISDMKLQVDAANAHFYPDIFVTCDSRDRAEETYKRHPSLIIEVLSNSTAGVEVRELVHQPTRQPAFQQGEPVRPVGLVMHGVVRGIGDVRALRGIDRQGVEVVTDQFGAEILLRREPGETGEVFQLQAVLDALVSK
jgi:hypothetical protein